jgi:hypothetical protein
MNTLWMLASLVIVAGPFTYLARHYAAAPARVPMQIGIDGKHTWYGPKQALWAIAATPLAVCCLIGYQIFNGRPIKNLPAYLTPDIFIFITAAFMAVIFTAGLALLLGRLSLGQFFFRVFLPAIAGFTWMAFLR